MMRIFAVYFVFLSIIIAGCTSITSDPLPIDEEGLELQAVSYTHLTLPTKA